MELRWYQLEAIDAFYNYFIKKSGNPVIAMPTGTGKALVIAETIRSVFSYYKGQRIMMLTHVKELIDQNYQELLGIWPTAPVCIYSAGLKRKETHAPIIFAGVDSVAKRAALFGHIDLIFVDECHTISTKDESSYLSFINDLKAVNPKLKVIGYTATPYRMGHGLLTEADRKGKEPLFTDIAYDICGMEKFNRLIAEGFLVKLVPKVTKQELDVSRVDVSKGEYDLKELQAAVDRDEITNAAIEEMITLGENRNHWLVFAAGIEHAQHVTDKLNEQGVPACCVHSKIGDEARDRLTAEFKRGKYRALVNNGVFTTGFNFPSIDLIGMLRPTQSPGLWVQMLGRGTRPVWMSGYDLSTIGGRLACIAAGPKQDCLVLDFAGNTKRLGPINDPLIPKPRKKKGDEKGEPPVRICEACNTYNHARATHCICCGQEFKALTKLVSEAGTDKLLAGDAPKVEIFRVKSVTYSRYTKVGTPDMVKVSYFSNLQQWSEWVCPEHTNFAGRKARQWWMQRLRFAPILNIPFPKDTNEALELIEKLPTPTHIRVWVNKAPYPQIMDYDFGGTGWGSEKEKQPAPTAKTNKINWSNPKIVTNKPLAELADDEVPF